MVIGRKNIIAFYIFCIQIFGFEPGYAQDISSGIKLLSHWNNPNLPRNEINEIWNDITGYHDTVSGKEYAIAGSTDSIYFFDISDPTKIILVDVESGRSTNMINRDYECYSHYVYCVSDSKNKGSLQVFDLQYLPDSVHKVYDSDSLSYNTHSIFIEAKSKRLYMCVNRLTAGSVAAMDILSLENPEYPSFMGRLQVPIFFDSVPAFRYVHDVYVRNDTAYCSVEYKGLWVYDLRRLDSQQIICIIKDYPENGYNHSSTLDKTGKYIMFTDEIPAGLSVKIYDIHDLQNPKLLSLFRSNTGATPHNPYWVGSFAYISYYHDGFYIFDLSIPEQPWVAGYYHTSKWPPSSYEGFTGCWGIYPWLPSGVVLASDMGEGIFVLQVDSLLTGLQNQESKTNPFRIYPNPFQKQLHVEMPDPTGDFFELKLYNSGGELILHKIISEPTFDAETENMDPGMYFVVLQSGTFQWVRKLIKQ